MSISTTEIPFGAPLFLPPGQMLWVNVVTPGTNGMPDRVFASAGLQAIQYVEKVTVTLSGPSPNGYDEASVIVKPWQTVEEIAAYVEGDGTDEMRVALADGIRRKHI